MGKGRKRVRIGKPGKPNGVGSIAHYVREGERERERERE